jgi:hypothetical protein
MKARIIAAVLFAALALGSAVAATPAAAATMNPEDSYLVCPNLTNHAAVYFPLDSAPRYSVYAIRIDGGPWRYAQMYFSRGQEWQWLNGGWVATGSNWAPVWVPDDGRGHWVEVYEARSKDNKTYSPWIQVASPCRTGTLWAPMF